MMTFGSSFRKYSNGYNIGIAFMIIVATILLIENVKGKGTADITYNVASENGQSWYYDIYINEKLFIRQAYLPAVSGNKLIHDKLIAEALARKVVKKIESGENPAISAYEVDEIIRR